MRYVIWDVHFVLNSLDYQGNRVHFLWVKSYLLIKFRSLQRIISMKPNKRAKFYYIVKHNL